MSLDWVVWGGGVNELGGLVYFIGLGSFGYFSVMFGGLAVLRCFNKLGG